MSEMSNTALDHDPACAFAVNLKWSQQPITRESLPDIPALQERYLYLCRKRRGNRVLYGIRAGFFPDGRTAARFAASLRRHFAAAEPVLVRSREFSASASAGLAKRRTISKPKPIGQQRVTRLRSVPDQATVKSVRADSPASECSQPAPIPRTANRTSYFPTKGKAAGSTAARAPSQQIASATEDKEYLVTRRPALLFYLLVAVVILHSNFSAGSINNRVALFSMLLVAASGFLGRYLYIRTHHGLSGRKITRQELQREVVAIRNDHASTALVPQLHERLLSIENRVLSSTDISLDSVVRPLGLALKARWAEFRLTTIADREVRRSKSCSRITVEQREELQRSIHQDIVERLRNLRRIIQFSLHERLFSLWRALHYPVFLVLIVASVAHVLAMYT